MKRQKMKNIRPEGQTLEVLLKPSEGIKFEFLKTVISDTVSTGVCYCGEGSC